MITYHQMKGVRLQTALQNAYQNAYQNQCTQLSNILLLFAKKVSESCTPEVSCPGSHTNGGG